MLGLNFIPLFMLGYTTLQISSLRHKVLVCAGLAALGLYGGGGLSLVGTTFYDNVTSLGVLFAALLVVRHLDALFRLPAPRAMLRVLLFGIPAGLVMGLKLPSVLFCVGLCFAFLFVGGDWRRRLLLSVGFGCGIIIGCIITYGYWGWFLQTHFQNPFFPYFNGLFKSPLAPLTSARDIQYVPHSLHDYLLFPWIFVDSPYRVGEVVWSDWRILILYILLPLALVLRLFFGRAPARPDSTFRHNAARYLLWMGVLSYVTWLFMFAIYRYVIPLEMITPLLIVFACGMLPLRFQMRGMITLAVLLVVAGSVQPGNWTRRASWLDHFIEVTIPPLGDTSNAMILMAGYEPYSHLIPAFPPEIPFVRIQSNFSNPNDGKGINRMIRDRVMAHNGRYLMLIPPWQHDLARGALSAFNLRLDADACQIVLDRLYDDKPLDLCRVSRLSERTK